MTFCTSGMTEASEDAEGNHFLCVDRWKGGDLVRHGCCNPQNRFVSVQAFQDNNTINNNTENIDQYKTTLRNLPSTKSNLFHMFASCRSAVRAKYVLFASSL